jgi:hypothetical protein
MVRHEVGTGRNCSWLLSIHLMFFSFLANLRAEYSTETRTYDNSTAVCSKISLKRDFPFNKSRGLFQNAPDVAMKLDLWADLQFILRC